MITLCRVIPSYPYTEGITVLITQGDHDAVNLCLLEKAHF